VPPSRRIRPRPRSASAPASTQAVRRTPVGGYGYVGWAPMPPAWIWFGGVSVGYRYGPYYPWVFCSSDYLFYPHVHYYIVRDRHRMTYAARHTRPYHRTASARPVAAPRSPTMREANVPSRAVPRQRVRSERLVTPVSGRATGVGLRESRVPERQRGESAAPARGLAPSPVLRGERAPTERREAAPSRIPAERRAVTPKERREVTPQARRAPRPEAKPPSRARARRLEQRRAAPPPRSSPGRELMGAPRGRPRTNR
jgi:hypothetical protein